MSPKCLHNVFNVSPECLQFRRHSGNSLLRSISHHLSLIAGHEQFNFISLIVPAFRKPNLNQPWSILHAIYKAYDHFDIVHDVSSLSISNQLKLPLNKMFTFIPDHHWLHRHPRFLASDFFIIDYQTGRLRLRVRGEYPIKPGLCYRLYKDILQRRTISLQPYLWNFILSDIPTLDVDLTLDKLAQQFCSHLLWKKCHAGKYRQLDNTTRYQSKIKLPSSRLRLFWNSSMLLQARSVWYRILNYKLPTMSYLHSIRVVASAQCRLCEAANESLQHFLVLCPLKPSIWLYILHHFFPGHLIQSEDIWNLLRSLKLPPYLTRLHHQQLITVASTTL
ncbi:hypothetical protein G6F56_009203 [Rhizopus delemar]|nr:hypothetical protein G6F56_009203 [Rhizopus delemar]